MTIEFQPLGQTCNLMCPYCYEHPMRDAGNARDQYDLDAVMRTLEQHNGHFTVFGGEPLLMPIKDLETLWEWGFKKWKRNSVQTNGSLITDEHVALFKKYKVHVGLSMDGPEEMNDSRWAGSLEKTRVTTKRSQDAIELCLKNGISLGMIVTIWRGNADLTKRSRFKQWLHALDALGVRSMRLHMMEVEYDSVAEHYGVDDNALIDILLDLANFEKELSHLRFDLFKDQRKLLLGDDACVSCIWSACDPFTTEAVTGVDGKGNSANCGRAQKDGISSLKADTKGFERQLALYETPFEFNGCQDCRFFLVCKGHCSGTAIDGDWRNRTQHCKVIFSLLEQFEQEFVRNGKRVVSLAPERLDLEKLMLDSWAEGYNARICTAQEVLSGKRPLMPTPQTGQTHGDHTDGVGGALVEQNGRLHGDHVDHGDSKDNHGDQTYGDGVEHGDVQHGDYNDHGDSEDDHGDVQHGNYNDHGDSGTIEDKNTTIWKHVGEDDDEKTTF